MNSWTDGYVADVDYTYGYYPDLNPLRARFTLLCSGYACPSFEVACELGFGQGLSINIHSAASQVDWIGTDFNPTQVLQARDLASYSNSGVRLFDDSFGDFCCRDDLPEFDFIGLHGIWSWISEENQESIIKLLRRRLKVGGVVYISYNALPGWSSFAPLRQLMYRHSKIMGSDEDGIVNRIDKSLDFLDSLFEIRPAFALSHAILYERYKKVATQNRRYLAHEYFNSDWSPIYFSNLAESLSDAKLQFVGSVSPIDNIVGLNFSVPQRKFLDEIKNPVFKEDLKDFIQNKQFRRDLWVRGARILYPEEQKELLRNCRVILAVCPDDIPDKISTPVGEAKINDLVLSGILEKLSDYNPTSLYQLESRLSTSSINFSNILEVISILLSNGYIQLAQDDNIISKVMDKTKQLNAAILSRARHSAEIGFLSSPVTGGGIAVSRFSQLFLSASREKLNNPRDFALQAWKVLKANGERIVHKGGALVSDEDNVLELERQASEFISKKLPLLKKLEII